MNTIKQDIFKEYNNNIEKLTKKERNDLRKSKYIYQVDEHGNQEKVELMSAESLKKQKQFQLNL